jgi:sugar/nucleoside kinase (ribokinase family)
LSGPSVIVAGDRLVVDHIAVLDALPKVGAVATHAGLTPSLRVTYRGGCAANIVVTLARLGVSGVYASAAAAEDSYSAEYLRFLSSLGVGLDFWSHVPGMEAVHCYTFYDRTGSKLSFMDSLDHPATPSDFGIPDTALAARPIVALVGARLDDAWSAALTDLRQRARQHGCLIVQMMCGELHQLDLAAIADADILICNEFESGLISAAFDVRPEVRRQGPLGSRMAFVTRGAVGSVIRAGGKQVLVPAVEIHGTVEPTGAGDAYAAGVIAALANGAGLTDAGRAGTLVASEVAANFGPQPSLPAGILNAVPARKDHFPKVRAGLEISW